MSDMFFMRMEVPFLALTVPNSIKANPACMNRMMAPISSWNQSSKLLIRFLSSRSWSCSRPIIVRLLVELCADVSVMVVKNLVQDRLRNWPTVKVQCYCTTGDTGASVRFIKSPRQFSHTKVRWRTGYCTRILYHIGTIGHEMA